MISSQLFEAYLKCSTKCWLRSRAEPATGNFYADWAHPHDETYLEHGLKRSFATVPESDRATAPPIPKNPRDVTWCLAIDVRWRTKDLESRVQAVERIPSGHDRLGQFIPYRFQFTNQIAREHRLLLAFDALLLSEALGREVNLGKIVHGDSPAFRQEKPHRARLHQHFRPRHGEGAPDVLRQPQAGRRSDGGVVHRSGMRRVCAGGLQHAGTQGPATVYARVTRRGQVSSFMPFCTPGREPIRSPQACRCFSPALSGRALRPA
jgi:hypothetical protein